MLDAIVGYDERDHEATKEASKFIPFGGYKQFLKLDGLKGKRLGVVRKPFVDSNKTSIFQAFESHLNTLRYHNTTKTFLFHLKRKLNEYKLILTFVFSLFEN